MAPPKRRPGPGRRNGGRNGRLSWWLAAAGVAVLVTVAALATTSSGGGTGTTSASSFDLPALDGQGRVRLVDLRGTPVVVNFFASWCTACEFELPAFAAAAAALRGRVAFVGVNALETGDGHAMARRFELAQHGFLLARDVGGAQGSGLHRALGGRGMPITAFYDGDGRLVDVAGGALPEEALADRLRQLYGVEVRGATP